MRRAGARTGASNARFEGEGKLFGRVAISDNNYGFPCVLRTCVYRAVPAKSRSGETTVAALKAARVERDAHIAQMRERGDQAHIDWSPDRDEIVGAFNATFSMRRKVAATR